MPKACESHPSLQEKQLSRQLKSKQNMKELKLLTQNNDSTAQTAALKYLSKRNYWKLAKRKQVSGIIQRTNFMAEEYYKMVIAEVKRLYAPLKLLVFERDYRECTGEYGCAMHTFCSAKFYFDLSCDPAMEYWFAYDFYNCPFEAEIVTIIERLFAVNTQSKRVHKPETFKLFNVQTDENKEYYYTLQAD